jgi:hypothetical protein
MPGARIFEGIKSGCGRCGGWLRLQQKRGGADSSGGQTELTPGELITHLEIIVRLQETERVRVKER